MPMHWRLCLPLLLLALWTPSQADAIKYRQANGKVLITNQYDPEIGQAVAVRKDDPVPSASYQSAIADLQRQKQFLRTREQSASKTTNGTVIYGQPAPVLNDRSGIDACLRQVTGTFGLSPGQEAHRRLNCYQGTSGLNDECQRTVASTMRLSSNEEQYYKARCPL